MTENTSERRRISKYHSKKPVKIVPCDELYAKISQDESRLLYYVNIPYLKKDGAGKYDIDTFKQLQVEIRIPTSNLKEMIQSIIDDLEENIGKPNTTPTDQMPLEVA